MPDVMSPEERSRLMSRIRGKNTQPELLLQSNLRRSAVRFRTHARDVPGTPDIVLSNSRVAVFVDGCFFHGCPRHFQAPATRRSFWKRKLDQNKRRREE